MSHYKTNLQKLNGLRRKLDPHSEQVNVHIPEYVMEHSVRIYEFKIDYSI